MNWEQLKLFNGLFEWSTKYFRLDLTCEPKDFNFRLNHRLPTCESVIITGVLKKEENISSIDFITKKI